MASSKRDEMLLRAVQAGKVDEVDDMLAEKNFNVDAADSVERSALWHAASDGDTDMMAVLMKHGANANAPDREGITPLIAALKEKQWAAAELVLDTADLNAKSGERGFTALHSALWMDLAEESDKRVRFLMERWANAKLPDASGVSAVASASDLAAKFPFAQTLLDVIEEYKDGPEARQRYLDAKKQREIKTAFNRENGESVEAPVRASWKKKPVTVTP